MEPLQGSIRPSVTLSAAVRPSVLLSGEVRPSVLLVGEVEGPFVAVTFPAFMIGGNILLFNGDRLGMSDA
jgi:hypothetical protein